MMAVPPLLCSLWASVVALWPPSAPEISVAAAAVLAVTTVAGDATRRKR